MISIRTSLYRLLIPVFFVPFSLGAVDVTISNFAVIGGDCVSTSLISFDLNATGAIDDMGSFPGDLVGLIIRDGSCIVFFLYV